MRLIKIISGGIGGITLLLGVVFLAQAQELNGPAFSDSNPVLTIQGGFSSSSNFQLFSGTGQTVIGESTSSAFITHLGFFYWPLVTAPVVSATVGSNAKVDLTWTAAVGTLGFNVSGYQVGQSLSNSGPFSYTTVGNFLVFTASGLTNNTQYFFVVRGLDAFGNSIVTSSVVAATPTGVVPPPPPSPSPSPAPSPGLVSPSPTSTNINPPLPTAGTLTFFGFGPPHSTIFVLRNGVIIGSGQADASGVFSVALNSLPAGQGIFTIYGVDASGGRTAPVTILLTLIAGQPKTVSAIILPPSIASDKETVRATEPITIFGFTAPNSEVDIFDATDQLIVKTKSDSRGRFSEIFDTKKLRLGEHVVRAKVVVGGVPSDWSRPLTFIIGERTIIRPTGICQEVADLNHDCRVNLIDFSILIYWFPRLESPPFEVDFNHDGRVDIFDFSILMYHWTG